ncbi:MAG: metallophosphoesterase [Methylobacterium mesophilicum]|nr:metallophosphoesterase [Methylobacterium mesophilicum]
MKLLVVSDLHAYSVDPADGSRPSFMSTKDSSERSLGNSFLKLIQDGTIDKPDIIICPGDLGDKADATAINYAWTFLKNLTALSNKRLLLAATGNHDLNSRYAGGAYDAKGQLLELLPVYPVLSNLTREIAADVALQMRYWTWNFCSKIVGKVRFVVLNTSAFHGHGEGELEHGRISDITLASMKKNIKEENSNLVAQGKSIPKLNVLICHHHLEKDGSINDRDYSSISGAHALTQFLSDTDYGRWLVIHGHRHRARMFMLGGQTGPVVLSSASLSATRDRDYDNTSPCQAHLVTLDFDAMQEHSFVPAGSVKSFTWVNATGWDLSRSQDGGLPPDTGFGFRGSLDRLARDVATFINGRPLVPWSDVISELPTIPFVTYSELSELSKTLKNDYDLTVMFDSEKRPFQCGKTNA